MICGSLLEAARDTGASLLGADRAFRGVSTDSRNIAAGQLYVALRGARFDGHDFADEAVRQGAAGCLLEKELGLKAPQLLVADTRRALGDLARGWRKRFKVPVLGVTGSNGKTTVKEMMAAIMGQHMKVLVTRGNLNNDIGVPLTLFGMCREDRAAIIEMGANHPGEIAYLAGIARPTVGVVTNAGPAHLEGFGTVEGVARAKGEMFQSLGAEGIAIINADDQYAPLWREMAAPRRVISFGLHEDADVHARDLQPGDSTGQRFVLRTPAGEQPVRLRLAGQHNVMNALAAAAACHAAGVSLAVIVEGLQRAAAAPGRLQFKRATRGASICDDTYNANPRSLRAALETMQAMGGVTWLVLGDMGELGEHTHALHRDAGVAARELGVQRLFALGRLAALSAEAYGQGADHFEDVESLCRALTRELSPGVRVLVKGSRSMRMERVVQALAEDGGRALKAGS